jgi:hypothetical protein
MGIRTEQPPEVDTAPVAAAPRRGRSRVLVAVAVVVVAAAGAVGYESWPALVPSSTADGRAPQVPAATASRRPGEVRPRPPKSGPLGAADGVVPDGVTVFDDVPAVTNLDPALLAALHRAAKAARTEFVVNSGWRSPAYQEQLLREAVAKYGSAQEAARWVSTPADSQHVSGHAVDLGPTATTTWLSKHGAAYGLCQIYRNEPWHYELRPDAVDDGCPAPYADPTHDPRMQQ